MNKEDAVG